MKDLKAKGYHAAKWGVFFTVSRYSLQLVSQVVMARIIGPADFGVYSSALVVMSLAAFLTEIGFGWALINKAEITDEDIGLAFTWQTAIGVAGTLLIYFLSETLSAFFSDPRVGEILEWTAITCLLAAATSTSNNLLIRQLRIKESGQVQFISYLISYIVVGIPLAMYGAGLWALVVAWVLQATLRLILTFRAHPHSIRPIWWHENAKITLNFGATVLLTNVTNWLLSNIDRLIVGAKLNDRSMGLYTASSNLASTPNSLVIGALQPTFFSATSKIQNDRPALERAFRSVVSVTFTIVAPLYALLAASAPEIVAVLYGEKWKGAEDILRTLFLFMPAYVLWGLSTPILWNIGLKNFEALLQAPVIPLYGLICVYLVSSHGVLGAAYALGTSMVIRAILVSGYTLHRMQIPLKSILPDILRGAILSIGMYIAVWAISHQLQSLQPIIRGGTAIAGALILLVSLLAAIPILRSEPSKQLSSRLLSSLLKPEKAP